MDAAAAFGVVLRSLRLKAGFTQETLGFESGLRRTYISILELGNQQPTLTTILKLSKPLGCSAAELIALVEKDLAKTKSVVSARRLRRK